MTDEGCTVWGLGFSLRSCPRRVLAPITVVGYIVATNLASAPACAVHDADRKPRMSAWREA